MCNFKVSLQANIRIDIALFAPKYESNEEEMQYKYLFGWGMGVVGFQYMLNLST
jgi:hypothetical protein